MGIAVQLNTKVLPGHRVEVTSPELPDGAAVSVLVIVEDFREKRPLNEVLKDYKGGSFKSAQEVDDYLRAERDSWDH